MPITELNYVEVMSQSSRPRNTSGRDYGMVTSSVHLVSRANHVFCAEKPINLSISIQGLGRMIHYYNV